MNDHESPFAARFASWRQERRQRANAQKLRAASERLEDAAYDAGRWGFADNPAATRRRLAELTRLIRDYLAAGGDNPMQFKPWRNNVYLYEEAAVAAGWKAPEDDD